MSFVSALALVASAALLNTVHSRVCKDEQYMPGLLTVRSVLVALTSLLLPTAITHAEDPEIREWLSPKHEEYETRFGNIQVEYRRTDLDNGRATTVTHLRFWSRDNEYFRLDTKILEAEDPEKVDFETRLIVRPEGYVKLAKSPGTSTLAVVAYGATADGLSVLQGNRFFSAGTRAYIIVPMLHYITRMQNADSGFQSTEQSRDDNVIMWRGLWSDGAAASQIEIACDAHSGLCLRYSSDATKDGRPSHRTSAEKEYDAESIVPVLHVSSKEEADGSSWGQRFERLSVVEEPAPLGLFSLESQGVAGAATAGTWTRRLIILLVGLLLMGIYGIFHLRKHRT